jgi:hypothetical protein
MNVSHVLSLKSNSDISSYVLFPKLYPSNEALSFLISYIANNFNCKLYIPIKELFYGEETMYIHAQIQVRCKLIFSTVYGLSNLPTYQ